MTRRLEVRLGLIIVLVVVWCGVAAWRMSHEIDGERVFCLWDDAMISMTYARNLLDGYGLTWSRRGDAVEGFTHPLWVGVMILVHLLPIAREHTSLAMQVVSAACLVGTVIETKRLTQRHFAAAGTSPLPAALAVALYYPLALWTMFGMETGLQAWLIVRATRQALDVRAGDERAILGFWITATLATLLRMDLLIPMVAGAVVIVIHLWKHGPTVRVDRRGWLGLSIFVGLNLAYLAFRVAYYDDILPNTYYLKMTGTPTHLRVARGLMVTGRTAAELSPLLVVAFSPLVFRRLRASGHGLVLSVIALAFAYSIWVGGDAWEWAPVGANRFISGVMPLVFAALTGVVDRARSAIGIGRVSGSASARIAGPILVLGTIGVANGFITADPGLRARQVLLIEEPPHHGEHRWWIERVGELQGIFDDRATVAVEWAGVPAYFSPWRMCDELGYNDRHMAHGPNTVEVNEPEDFQPGHMKWDLDYVLRELQPDVMMDPWNVPFAEVSRIARANNYIRRHGYWVRPDSPYVGVDPQPP